MSGFVTCIVPLETWSVTHQSLAVQSLGALACIAFCECGYAVMPEISIFIRPVAGSACDALDLGPGP